MPDDKTNVFRHPPLPPEEEQAEAPDQTIPPTRPPLRAGPPPARPPGSIPARPGAPAPNRSGANPLPPRPAAPGTNRSGANPVPGRSPAGPGGAKARFFPQPPHDIEATGLTGSMVEELILKAIFFAGEMRGMDISDKIKLPSHIVDPVIEGLRKQKYIDMKGGGSLGVGKSTMIYQLTTFATDLLHQIQERNRYNGPAPVTLSQWTAAIKQQSVRGNRITRQKMEDKFGDLIIRDYIFDGIGPAMNSGRAMFFYGPPGNGKTAVCQCMIDSFDGDIYVPHAILVDDFIIRVFDPTIHKAVKDDGTGQPYDNRWVRCRKPLVIVGGELTLEMLDLTYSPEVKYYEAPFQLKATNGMLLIDDFGRQKVSPKDLLNRWIVPLESDVDYLTMHTGKKLQVPFDVFVAFSTNLDPTDLVDDAFLRRVRYKLEIRRPDEEQFHEIWELMCRKKGVPYDANMIQYLIDTHYTPTNRPYAACQPRDLLEQMIDMSYYRGLAPQLSEELFDAAVKSYFVKFD